MHFGEIKPWSQLLDDIKDIELEYFVSCGWKRKWERRWTILTLGFISTTMDTGMNLNTMISSLVYIHIGDYIIELECLRARAYYLWCTTPSFFKVRTGSRSLASFVSLYYTELENKLIGSTKYCMIVGTFIRLNVWGTMYRNLCLNVSFHWEMMWVL